MRHHALGYPPAGRTAAGVPCSAWLRLFAWSHEPGPEGWSRREWPDGGPLLLQPWPQVAAFAVIRDERGRIQAERSSRGARAGGGPPTGVAAADLPRR